MILEQEGIKRKKEVPFNSMQLYKLRRHTETNKKTLHKPKKKML